MEKKGKSSAAPFIEDGVPEAKYTRFGERIRQAIPGPMQCSVGCGGKNCKWENPAKWSDADQAIKGVFSSWVLEDVVAMSRPSTKIIKQYKMIDQFKKHNIRSIINLQRPGEHASCGPPLDKESLFTYKPQEFMDNDIFFYNFGWKDYGVTSLHTILDMVKVMSFTLEEGKVAVHCHAGLGRTGVLIACYLVYSERMDPGSAILRVRKNRSNSIQTRGQIACITEFYQFLRPLRIVFPQVVPHSKRLTLKQFLIRQRHILHGFESRELRHTPKLVHVICRRLSQIAQSEVIVMKSSQSQEDVVVDLALKRCNTVADIKESLPGAFVNETKVETTHQCEDLLEFLSNSPTDVEAVLSPRVLRKGSARSVSSTDGFIRPQSAGDVPMGQDGSVFVPISPAVDNELPHEEKDNPDALNTSLKVDNRNEEDERENLYLLEESNHSSSSSPSNLQEKESYEEADGRDEQLERDVNEILGCNNNNNHSVIDASTNRLSEAHKQSDLSEDSSQIPSVLQKNKCSDDEAESNLKETHKVALADGDTESASQPSTTMRKIRHSAGRSETMLPTGLSTKNPRNSAKARPPSSTLPSVSTRANEDNDNTDSETLNSSKEVGIVVPLSNVVPSDDDSVGLLQTDCLTTPNKITEIEADCIDTNLTAVVVDTDSSTKSNIESSTDNSAGIQSLKARPMFTFNDDPALPIEETISVDECSDDIDKLSSEPDQSIEIQIIDSLPIPPPTDNTDQPEDMFSENILRTSTDRGLVLSSIDVDDEYKEKASFEIGRPATDDDDLDEIINIADDEQSSLGSDTESEDAGFERADSSGKLSHSIASRVSWSHMKINIEEESKSEEEQRLLSASSKVSKHSGRRTPLMYRGEKNMTLIDGEGSRRNTSDRPVENSSSSDEELTEDAKLEYSFDGDEDREKTQDNANFTGQSQTLDNQSNLKIPVMTRINATKSLNDLTSASHDEGTTSFSRCSSSGDMRHPSPHGSHGQPDRTNLTNVGLAIAYKLIDDEWLWEKVYSLQVEVNNHKDAWTSVAEATDAYLLSSLMWSWVEHLAEPILTPKFCDQLLSVINRPGDAASTNPSHVVANFEKALSSLDPGVSTTTQCLLSCVLSFPALPRRITESMVHRTLAALTQTSVTTSGTSAENSDLEQGFQNYINAKYEMTGRRRFIEETKQDPPVATKHVSRTPSTDSESSQIEGTSDPDKGQVDQGELLRRSAGSVHSTASSGSSNTGSVIIAVPRIAVN